MDDFEAKADRPLRSQIFAKRKLTKGDFALGIIAAIVVTGVTIGIIVLVINLNTQYNDQKYSRMCDPSRVSLQDQCNSETATTYSIVETVPYGDFNQTMQSPFQSTTDAWIKLFQSANHTINIACSYFTMNQTDFEPEPGDSWGEWGHDVGVHIYQQLIDAHNRGVTIRIVENTPGSKDTLQLQNDGYAEARLVDVAALNSGSGVLHAKFFIIDNSTFYIGSANMDWRSLTQVKEVGIVMENSCMAADLQQIFEMYWLMGELDELPTVEEQVDILATKHIEECNRVDVTTTEKTVEKIEWPYDYQAFFNRTNPASVHLSPTAPYNNTNPEQAHMYFTSAPEAFCPPYRTNDIEGILDAINSANNTISLSLMDYAPITFYEPKTRYWSIVDNALRAAAIERGVDIRLLVSKWEYGSDRALQFLLSLDSLQNVTVKFFEIPSIPGVTIPYTRVNHAKYMVTGVQKAVITTSNWSADYFLSTGGVSFITDDTSVIEQLQWIFNRDWDSQYCFPITEWYNTTTTS